MSKRLNRASVWGWMLFDWATQPFHTLIVTFIFGPYFTSAVMTDEADAVSTWAFTIGFAGIAIALAAPLVGALADTHGPRKPLLAAFCAAIIIGTGGLWIAVPGMEDVTNVLLFFALAMVGIEMSIMLTNAMLPDIVPRDEIGRISGSGWAFGYVGGLVALILVLLLVAEGPEGRTLIGLAPLGGLDPELREGTRAVGPITAIWCLVFMVPFFLWVPDQPRRDQVRGKIGTALSSLGQTLRGLPRQTNLFNMLIGSMFYRDALIGGIYAFGGIYAVSVLGWSTIDIGVFGILTLITGAIGAWYGGRADKKRGPRRVVIATILILLAVSIAALFISRTQVFGIVVAPDSRLPDIAFYILGALIGAAGGSLQAASRTLLVHNANPKRMTEAFGLYALTGKATTYIAPFSIGIATQMFDDTRAGIFLPIVAMLVLGLVFILRMPAAPPQDEDPSHAAT